MLWDFKIQTGRKQTLPEHKWAQNESYEQKSESTCSLNMFNPLAYWMPNVAMAYYGKP